MSVIHVNQIRSSILSEYSSFIDTSDASSEDDRMNKLLTRGLAGNAVRYYCPISSEHASKFITDGFKDNGIDSFYHDETTNTNYIVQSKWHHDGSGTIERGDIQKFIQGVKDIYSFRFDRFNEKVRNLEPYITEAINSAGSRLTLLVIHTGTQLIGDEPKRDITDFIDELNNPDEVATFEILNQGKIYTRLLSGTQTHAINESIMINNWGLNTEPYKCFYGTVSAIDLAELWGKYNPYIFAPNIRNFLGPSEVNKEITETLLNHPENFFYFNNGVTFLCSTIEKRLAGGTSRESGVFDCTNITIINGAQTVGSIGSLKLTNREVLENARVTIRIISLENTPDLFDKQITRATNTQNRIESRDFITQDSEHERLRMELLLSKIYYSFKRGDEISDKSSSFTFEEGIVAIACSKGLTFAVQAKREVSKLWEDISRSPYKELINQSLSGFLLWNIVLAQRLIDREISNNISNSTGKQKSIFIHGNRFISALTFSRLKDNGISFDHSITSDTENKIITYVKDIGEKTLREIDSQYPDSLAAYIFKNLRKCESLKFGIH